MFERTKSIIIKIDDFREEKLEIFLANDVLKRFDELKNADDLRKAMNMAIINAVGTFAASNGLPALTADVKNQINEQAIKVEKKLNEKLQNQLNKTSRKYKERHSVSK